MSTVDPNNKRVLALMPHPDDAEILCGGTLIRLAETGYEVHVATMTPGDMGSPTLPRSEIARIRREEARKGAESMGAKSYTCLEVPDIEITFDVPARKLVGSMLRKVDPFLIITTPPRDYMFDHEITSHLVRDACFNGPMNNFYTPGPWPPLSAIPYLYYADALEGHDIYGVRSPITCFIDVSGVIDRKAGALACHASQREWLRAHHGMDSYIESMKQWAAKRGAECGTAYAEGFFLHQGHPHPQDDILCAILGGKPAE